ncbi:MAG: NAD-binding protein [Halobacteriales archaeon]|nr:NAD-binding protein [Halobacteriales archaeon]
MEWRSWWDGLGLRVTVGLTMAVAILSVLTGIVKITQTAVVGPLAPFLPAGVEQSVGFTGALTGFLMMASALGLRRGLRAAWYSTLVLLPVTALQGLLQSSPLSLPLVGLSVIAIPNVLAHRRRFDRALELTGAQIAAVAAIVGAQVYGTVGTFALRDQFGDVETLVDAFYFTLVTASTVGYGDSTPETQAAKLFGMSVLVVGTASFALALGTLFGPAIEARFQQALGRMTESQLELLDDHLLVLGHGDLTDVILEELGSTPYLVITADADWAASMSERDVRVLVGDPADEGTLRRAQLADASAVLVATDNDADDALAVLTTRQLNPDVRIVAAATNRENIEKMRRAGADVVISPATIGGHLLVESALGDEGVESVAQHIVGGDELRDAADDGSPVD